MRFWKWCKDGLKELPQELSQELRHILFHSLQSAYLEGFVGIMSAAVTVMCAQAWITKSNLYSAFLAFLTLPLWITMIAHAYYRYDKMMTERGYPRWKRRSLDLPAPG